MTNEKRGNCPLCKAQNVIIENSHILPKFIYRIIKNREKEIRIICQNKQKDKLIITDKQDQAYLLCGSCEDLLQKHEDRFKRFFDNLTKLSSDNRQTLMYIKDGTRESKRHVRSYTETLKILNQKNFRKELLNNDLFFSFKYLTLSIFIKRHYIDPSNDQISENMISKIENFLLSNNKLKTDMIIYINTNTNSLRAVTEVFYTTSNQYHHFTILLADIVILIVFNENKQDIEKTLCCPADFLKEKNQPYMTALANHLTTITDVINNTAHSQSVNDFLESIKYKKSPL